MKGQVLLITVFALIFALFSIYLLLAPIKDKLLRIKEMENVYQAFANAEKGLEASLLDIVKGINLNLDKQISTYPTQNCGGITYKNLQGLCTEITYQPTRGGLWTEKDKFLTKHFLFRVIDNDEVKIFTFTTSDGYFGKIIRTIFLGSLR